MRRAVTGAALLAAACGLLVAAGPTTAPMPRAASRPSGSAAKPVQAANPSAAPIIIIPKGSDVDGWWNDLGLPRLEYFSPPREDTFESLQIPRPDWLVWWEANRDAFLAIDDQSRRLEPDQEPSPEPRRRALEALLKATQSDLPQLRAAAALALGKIGERTTFDVLQNLALHDPVLDVRLYAIVAIGLLDTPQGEVFLVDANFHKRPMDHQAALIALGLMSQTHRKSVQDLHTRLQQGFGDPRKVSSVPVPIPTQQRRSWLVLGRAGLVGWAMSAWAQAQRLDPAEVTAPLRFVGQRRRDLPPLHAYDSHDYSRFGGPVSLELDDFRSALLEGSWLAASAISSWALSERVDSDNAQLLVNVLKFTNMPWVASAAILSIGHQNAPNSVATLASVLLRTPEAMNSPVYRLLDEQNARTMYAWQARGLGALGYRVAMQRAFGLYSYLQVHEFTADADQPDWAWLQGNSAAQQPDFIWHIFLKVEPAYVAHLRASAAIALGMIDCPASRQALEEALKETRDDYRDIYQSAALISLGQQREGAMEAAVGLMRLAHPSIVQKAKKEGETPLRGFAAIALGLYSRPLPTPTGPVDRPGYERFAPILAEGMTDPSGPEDFRAACALALGLTGRTENLKYLQAASGLLAPKDALLAGYVVLARGMLGDRNVMDLAKAFLAATNRGKDLPVIIGRRAAVLGLGLLGTREAVPIIESCWGENAAIDREVAFALSMLGAYGSAQRLVAAMEQSDRVDQKVLAANCLGDLFTKVRPQRLSRLLSNQNILMNTSRLVPYRAMANEFLFAELVPLFQEQWKSER